MAQGTAQPDSGRLAPAVQSALYGGILQHSGPSWSAARPPSTDAAAAIPGFRCAAVSLIRMRPVCGRCFLTELVLDPAI